MTRKRSGKKVGIGHNSAPDENGVVCYFGRPERTPEQARADRVAEALRLVNTRPFQSKAAPTKCKISPHDRHKRFDFSGRARVMMGSADGISAAAPDDTLADHLYIAADPFSTLNPNFADFVADFDGVDEDMEEKQAVEEDREETGDLVIEVLEPAVKKGDDPDTLPEEALYLTAAQVMVVYAIPYPRRSA